MKVVEIRKLTTGQIAKESTKLREEITDLKRRLMTGDLENTRSIRSKRKDLARMLTVMGENLSKEEI